MAIKESTHWYDQEGLPAYTVIGKNGKERPTTLRDARQMDLVPSVTTIIRVAAAPGLENWKIDQALLSALTLPKNEEESLDNFMRRAKRDAKEQAIQAAAKGTQIHANIEAGFESGVETDSYLAVRDTLNELFPSNNWVAEDSFCSPLGYGGKIDLYSEQGVFVDFKTKENIEGKDPSKLVYDEHGMQLSAYAQGMEVNSPERVSVFIDRNNPKIVLAHVWDRDTHNKHLEMFRSLLNYWMLSKNYFPAYEMAA
jgi:hypothetical protein